MNEESFYIFLGKNISEARKEKGINQTDLSLLLGLTRASIVNIEKGRQRISIFDLKKASLYLGKEIQDLLPFRAVSIKDFKIIGLDKNDPDYNKNVKDIERFINTII